jgi:hypothetical protein
MPIPSYACVLPHVAPYGKHAVFRNMAAQLSFMGEPFKFVHFLPPFTRCWWFGEQIWLSVKLFIIYGGIAERMEWGEVFLPLGPRAGTVRFTTNS